MSLKFPMIERTTTSSKRKLKIMESASRDPRRSSHQVEDRVDPKSGGKEMPLESSTQPPLIATVGRILGTQTCSHVYPVLNISDRTMLKECLFYSCVLPEHGKDGMKE